MSPRPADPAVRGRLVEAAARILAGEGPHALTARRLAGEAGTSTMAVYTYFGGMEEVRGAVRKEGFARLAADLDATPTSDDPVADLVAAGRAYLSNGLANPHLYRAMFLEKPIDDAAAPEGEAAFQRLVEAVRRCMDAGRFDPVDPMGLLGWSVQLWTMRHGLVSLAIAGLLPLEHVPLHFADMSTRLFVGYGDSREAARRSVEQGMR
ncbi:TetR/AcrR family transcriptional regulator [Nonomuraea roseola]|uniref:TetR/AcrR family transcriptional regulator n=1 Tax=Nonomuraea roseola TaxID=46179 RepID=A0ABV5Q8U4_9ACTN